MISLDSLKIRIPLKKCSFISKELSETKGKVISDYQDFLEKQWLDELKEKYQVRANTQVLHSLIR